MALTVLLLLTHQACSYLHSVLFITHFCYPACLYFLLPFPVTFDFLGTVAVLRFSFLFTAFHWPCSDGLALDLREAYPQFNASFP